MRVFLLHGMGRSPLSMAPLSMWLRRRGYRTSLFGYSVLSDTLERIAIRFVEHVQRTLERDGGQDPDRPYAVIGHSLGSVITRVASLSLPPGFARFVMLAPPNRSPALSRAARDNALYRLLTGDAGRRLADHAFFSDLPHPNVPTLIIAGDGGHRSPWLPYRGKASDGIVSLEETQLAGVAHRVFPVTHTFIMMNAGVMRVIKDFLERGEVAEHPGGEDPDALASAGA